MKRYILALIISLILNLSVFAAMIILLVEEGIQQSKESKIISLSTIHIQKVITKKKEYIAQKKPKKILEKEVQKKQSAQKKVKTVVKKTTKKVNKIEKKVYKEVEQKSIQNSIALPVKELIIKKESIKKEHIVKEFKESAQAKYIRINFYEIQQAIHKEMYYPKLAKRRNIEGTVNVTFILNENGEILNLTTSLAHDVLVKSAKRIVLSAAKNFPRPNHAILIQVPIIYRLL